MKGELPHACEQPAAVPASTERRWWSRWMLLPAVSLLGECVLRHASMFSCRTPFAQGDADANAANCNLG